MAYEEEPILKDPSHVECPINRTNTSKSAWLKAERNPQHEEKSQPAEKTSISETSCPFVNESPGDIDSRNLMPRGASLNSPAQNQRLPLNQEREVSTIPKADGQGDAYWVYPSQQMFFNALKRKNWDPSEEDMKVIVPIHNAVNERAWSLILKYEELYKKSCGTPRLVKFQGRPESITPKARIKSWFGYTLPFDRHDWIVDRCGTQVRYVIDFYSGKTSSLQPDLPSFYLDVRPALTLQGLFDRVRYLFGDFFP